MPDSIPKSKLDRLEATALARFPHMQARLNQRFVVLPDPYSQVAWLVDLYDPLHPLVQRHASWAAAGAARQQAIQQALIRMVIDEPDRAA